LVEESEHLRREIASLKKVKDKLFLEIQRMKVPAPKRPVVTENETQTEQTARFESIEDTLRKVMQLEYRC
jgi:hypothetical protein